MLADRDRRDHATVVDPDELVVDDDRSHRFGQCCEGSRCDARPEQEQQAEAGEWLGLGAILELESIHGRAVPEVADEVRRNVLPDEIGDRDEGVAGRAHVRDQGREGPSRRPPACRDVRGGESSRQQLLEFDLFRCGRQPSR